MKDRPTVVRVISYLSVGGVEKRLLAILKELQREFNCQVVCIHSPGPLAESFREAGIPVTTIPFKGRFHPESLLRLAIFLRKTGAAVVHSHMYRPNASATVAALMARTPVVIANIHNLQHWDSKRQKRTDALLNPFRSHTVTVSWEVFREYLREVGATPEKTSVIHNGVLSPTRSERPRDALEGLGIPRDSAVVTCVARLVPQKGHGVLLEAWSGVEGIMKRPWLLLVGGGPLEGELQEEVERLGLSRVVMAGVRGDVDLLLGGSDCMVLSSFKEGFSNAILEAMALGVPPVVTEVGGAREAMVQGQTGVLLPPGDPERLRKALLACLCSPRLGKRMGIQARRRQERLFSLPAMAERTAQLYRGLLGLNPAGKEVE